MTHRHFVAWGDGLHCFTGRTPKEARARAFAFLRRMGYGGRWVAE